MIFLMISCRRLVREYFHDNHKGCASTFLPIKYSFYHFSNLNFSDEDLRVICQNHCESDYAECVEPCSDIDCLLECGRELTECSIGKISKI